MGQIGVMFRPEWPPEELPRFAREAERDGFAELWLVEDCFLVGGLTMAATVLALTQSLRVGIGLLPAAMRNPALAAMEIAGLGRLHPERLAVAFGHGVEPWMRQIDGEDVTVDGSWVHLADVQLRHIPDPAPAILIGTTGPKALAAAGRSADGILLAEGSGPEAVRWARGEAGSVGETVVYAWLSIDDDRDAAAEALRPQVQAWREMGLYPRLFELAGVDDGVSLDRLRGLAVAGDADDCGRAVTALWDAGADSVVVVPRHDDRESQVARFVADVLPRLGA